MPALYIGKMVALSPHTRNEYLMFKLEFDTDNRVFSNGSAGFEIARILREVVDNVNDITSNSNGTILDQTGNRVGKWNYVSEDD